jgi:hypothetical protein
MKRFNGIVLGYADFKNKNNTIVTERCLQEMISDFFIVPIFKDFNQNKLVGVVNGMKMDDDKRLIGSGYLINRNSLERKVLRWGFTIDDREEEGGVDIIKSGHIEVFGLIPEEKDAFKREERLSNSNIEFVART